MKRLLVCLLVLVLALGLVGCDSGGGGGSSSGSDSGSSSSGSSSSDSDAIATIDELKAVLAEDYADTDWYPDITDYTMETYLGAEVLVLHVAWGADDADWEASNAKQQGIQEVFPALNIEIAANVAMVDGKGTVWRLVSSSATGPMPMNEAFNLPTAPTNAPEFEAWLDMVYGPGGMVTLGPDETWYSSIESITFEDLYGSGAHLVIRTRIPAGDVTQQSLLQLALQSTGSPLLSNVSIFHAGDAGSSYGSAPGIPGMSGFYYPVAE
ncbi:MAG: hypothetical protein Q7W51_11270 [Coriobacteriia bacterium]|nr:hypothetical protein [Coriobacteriia bacterium]